MCEELVRSFRGEPEVQEWGIAVLHRHHAAGDVGCARVTWIRMPPDRLDRLTDAFRMRLLPRIEELPGFCSASLMVHRGSGRAVGTATFETRAAVEASREQSRAMREEFTPAMGAEVEDVAEMELVLAHLHVPEAG